MSGIKKIDISWELVGKIILALSAAVSAIVLLVNFINSRSPQITVKNELAYSIKIYNGDDYLGLVTPYSKETFKFYSEKVFPVEINWKGVRQEIRNVGPVGDLVTGTIQFVDNHQAVVVTHTTGKNDYFMPLLTNETDMNCRIVVNDGLRNEQYGGILLPQSQRVNAGYYEWRGNSNVTLYCSDGPHWWGERNGERGPSLKVKSPNGLTELTLTR